MDDVLIYSSTLEEHVKLLKAVFSRLLEKQFYCKLKKCQFFKNRTTFLGHDITSEGVQINPNKVEAVQKWPVPKSIRDVQSFLGFVQFFRKFI